MKSKHLQIQDVGQLKEADICFGDLTVFVGPQATGKSIALQLLKLMVDMGQVQTELKKYGLDWGRNLRQFLDIYFGEGMNKIWDENKSSIRWSNQSIDLARIITTKKQKSKDESLFYIPAQRVLTLRDGWPRPFTDYSSGDPFAVREFSEQLRLLMELEFAGNEGIFPQRGRLRKEFRDLLQKHVFSNFNLQVDKHRLQKRLVLGTNGEALPYMVWSAGQREFVPLLLGLYWLMPPSKVSKRKELEWVVLEEPEMGLHPRAITVVLLLIFQLIERGYRVCISTHSPHVLDALWGLRQLKENEGSPADVLKAFDAPKAMQGLATSMLSKDVKVFYFDRGTGCTKDISSLDPTDEEEGKSGWGGLTEFSGRINSVVANAVANSQTGTSP